MTLWRPSQLSLPLLIAGCSGTQTVTNPASSDAGHVATLWWWMLAVGSVILVAVCALVAIALYRGRRGGGTGPLARSTARTLVISGGIVLPLLAVLGLVLSGTYIGREMAQRPPEPAVVVDVSGHLWWWEVTYRDASGEAIATTANEIHLPVGKPVRFRLRSDNVIHSFWIPNLQGKTDLVPGQVNESWVTAERAGIFRGQCAEFCGTQHAHMAFVVVADSEDAFQTWLERQAEPAPKPDTATLEKGLQVFRSAGCAGCHAVRGTSEVGRLGPDLTHLANRRTLAAGTLPNTTEHLKRWITEPDAIKPGVKMPAADLAPDRLDALVTYLESLK